MKRLIAAAIIIAAILATSITGNLIIRQSCQKVEKLIGEIQRSSAKDGTKKSEEFFYFWESQRETLSIFVNHEQVDEIGRVAARMVSAERSKNQTDMFEAANEILYIMRGIKEDEKFSLFTVL